MALVLLVHACASPAGTPKDGARVRTAAQVPQSQVDRPPSEPGPELLRASQEGGAGALGVGGCYRRVAEAGPVRGGPRLPGYPVAEVEPGACSSRLLGRPAMGAAGTSSRVAGAAGVPGLGGALGATSHGDPPAWSLPPVPEYSAGELAAIAANVLAEVNRARRAVGAPPLRMDPRLMRAAARYSRELAARQEIEHLSDTPGRRTFRERIAAEGARARVAGENLARIGTSAEELPRRTVVAWDRSPGHRRNMLDPMFARTGIAVALGKDRIWYVAQVYATSD